MHLSGTKNRLSDMDLRFIDLGQILIEEILKNPRIMLLNQK